MDQYVNEIIVPYVESQRDALEDPSQAALVIMDNFKGWVTTTINKQVGSYTHFGFMHI